MDANKTWTGERLETHVFNETSIEHLHRYAIALELVQNKNVLDIACGEGYGSWLLAKAAAKIIAVDNNVRVVEKAKKKYVLPHLEFLAGSVDKIPAADHQFDVVVSFETIEHVSAQDEMLKEIKRVLKPGGILLISTPDKKNYTDKRGTRNPYHIKELYAEEFEALLKMFFSDIKILNQQISFSSVVTASDSEGLVCYTGDFNNIHVDEGQERLYIITIASDNSLPDIKNSLFNGKSVFAEAVTAKENMVISTMSYRLGHALLYPFKQIRKIFRNKTPDA